MNKINVYTKEEILEPSDEHVIQNFFGGRLTSREIVDKRTNERFGHGIDASLFQAWRPILLMLDARADREPRKQPAPLRGVPGSDGGRFSLEPDGRISTAPRLSLTINEGMVKVNGTFPDEQLARTEVSNLAKKRGLDERTTLRLLDLIKPSPVETTELKVELSFFGDDALRAVCKIACNLFAYHEPGLFLNSGCDPIREYVNGQSSAPAIQLTKMPEGANSGRFDHLVRVAFEKSGRIEGLIVLFGGLAFAVDLGPSEGRDGVFSYRVDQLGRQRWLNEAGDVAIVPEGFTVAASRGSADVQELAHRQVEGLWGKAVKAAEQGRIRSAIEETFQEMGVQPGGALDCHADGEAFAERVAQKVCVEVAGRVAALRKSAVSE